MIEEIRSIILSEGVAVELYSWGASPLQTTALVGRSTQQFTTSLYSLEAHKMTKFLPDIAVHNGDVIYNTVSGEYYLVASSYREVIDNQVVSTICHVLKSNVVIDVVGMDVVGDENGNLRKTTVVKHQGIRAYTKSITDDMRLYQPGLFANAEFLLYAPPLALDLMDQVVFKLDKDWKYKIEHLDYVQFPGLLLMHISSETRG